jgi:Fur family ferric uptake transcriptional regulator
MPKKENFIDKILNAGLKNTKYRVDIIELINKSDVLMSAKDIHKELLDKKIRINLSTVYRTLDKLVETNIINRVNLENEKQSMYEYNRNLHHHFFICQNCNKIIPIYTCPLEEYEKKLTKELGFEITGHRVEFYGFCKECKKNMIKKNA